MSKPVIYCVAIEVKIDGQIKSLDYEGTTPFLAFHAKERIHLEGNWYVIEQIHHNIHETEHDILHKVVLTCFKEWFNQTLTFVSAAAKDITPAIERNEKFEKRAHVKLENLMAYIDTTADWLTVNGELFPRRGKNLYQSVRLYCSAHDGTGRVVGASSMDFDCDNFSDFQLFTIHTRLAIGDVSRMKLYPQTIWKVADDIDITERIERLDAYEHRAGVALKGLFAYQTGINWIGINGEVHSLSGDSLNANIQLIADLLDENGRVIGNGGIIFYAESFFGFETFSTEIKPNGVEVFKIRLYPKLME